MRGVLQFLTKPALPLPLTRLGAPVLVGTVAVAPQTLSAVCCILQSVLVAKHLQPVERTDAHVSSTSIQYYSF